MEIEDLGSAPLPPVTEVEAPLSMLDDIDVPPTEDTVGLDNRELVFEGVSLCVVAVANRFGVAADKLLLIVEADKIALSADVDASV